MPYPKKKYRKGYPIYSLNELVWEHLNKGRWVYLRDKIIHPGYILNMTLQTVLGFIEARMISEAIDQQKEYYEKGVGSNANP